MWIKLYSDFWGKLGDPGPPYYGCALCTKITHIDVKMMIGWRGEVGKARYLKTGLFNSLKPNCHFKLSRQETPNSVLEGVYVLLNQILTHNLNNTCTRSIARSVGKTSMKDLNTTSLNKISRDISGPPGRKSIRALYLTGPIQDLLISLDLLGPFTRALYKVSSQDHHV